MPRLAAIIESQDPDLRNRSLDELCGATSTAELLEECAALDRYRRSTDNLYHQVRALFFLHAIHRFHLPRRSEISRLGSISFAGYNLLLKRRFEEALDLFLTTQRQSGPSDAVSSALAAAYRELGFQTLANQVRRSVRSVRGNRWMFRVGHPADTPLRVRPELLQRDPDGGWPLLCERTPVRMDLSHSGWSDIFFLGMDYPEAARVLNVSIDLAVRGRDPTPLPPIEAWLRVIDEPRLRLVSVDLSASADIEDLSEVFDFAKDYLGLLKAAVIAAGIVPPGVEGSGKSLRELLERLVGPGRGLELASYVRGIPKGSRLAVSTNLLASLIGVCMRATGQARSLEGPLEEDERRVVAARAILGEWLGGSGGGWQDSGGLWPGIKLIEGTLAEEGDPEYGISRGRLLPRHAVLGSRQLDPDVRQRLQDSLVLVHGGMAQNVGPILEMVTEKYLLRSEPEWTRRGETMEIMEDLLAALKNGDPQAIGTATTRNFFGPIQSIIPWASNRFTETVIERIRAGFGPDFWGFWMLGGMSGGGMGFIFSPAARAAAQERLGEVLRDCKAEMDHAIPFAIDPVVYDFSINDVGTCCRLERGPDALLPAGYYTLLVPGLLRCDPRQLSAGRRADLDRFGRACRDRPDLRGVVPDLFERLLLGPVRAAGEDQGLEAILRDNGFDPEQHELIRQELRAGRIGLAQNRLPAATSIEDVRPGEVLDALGGLAAADIAAGEAALREGRAAVVTLAAGAGSRWTQGAGVVKALNPFARLAGQHRSFVEVHLAKSRRTTRRFGPAVPHVFTTSYLTHDPIATALGADAAGTSADQEFPVHLSRGRSVGLRMVPMVRDLRFLWEELTHQVLDEQAQKVRDSLQAALLEWARHSGEGRDYTDNLPLQCLHPVGHWYEVPNLLLGGTLARLLEQNPVLEVLLLHNIDTLGADLDPGLLGAHLRSEACLTFEVIPRQVEDRGGGLARIDGRPRLVEGLALPREEDEFRLTYYNSLTTWIHVDRLLEVCGLTRSDLGDSSRVASAVRSLAARMPTYVTLKEVKKRWGHGQEDVFPVSQFEKLWGDMTALPEVPCAFAAVPRLRGQQLKDPAQLDGWLRDGSAAWVEGLCDW